MTHEKIGKSFCANILKLQYSILPENGMYTYFVQKRGLTYVNGQRHVHSDRK